MDIVSPERLGLAKHSESDKYPNTFYMQNRVNA